MSKPPSPPARQGRLQLNVGLSGSTADRLRAAIAMAEERAGLRAGTISPSAYVTSLVLDHLDKLARGIALERVGSELDRPAQSETARPKKR